MSEPISNDSETVAHFRCTQHYHLQQASEDMTSYTLLSIGSTMTSSSRYSTAIDWMRRTTGTSDICGTIYPMFVEDGATSYTHPHLTWICIFTAPMAPLWWTRLAIYPHFRYSSITGLLSQSERSYAYAMRSGCMTVYATFLSTSHLQFCVNVSRI